MKSSAYTMDGVAKAESNRARIPLLARILTCARARCSYVGCDRHRHVGPCNVEARERVVEAREIAAAAAAPVQPPDESYPSTLRYSSSSWAIAAS